jgi:hypothetical protein
LTSGLLQHATRRSCGRHSSRLTLRAMRKNTQSASHCGTHAQTAHRHTTATARRSNGTTVTRSVLPGASNDGRERTGGGTSSTAHLARLAARMLPARTGLGHRQRRCPSAAGLQVMAREPEQLLPPDLQHAAQLMAGAGCKRAWPVTSGHAHLLWWDQPEAGMDDTIKRRHAGRAHLLCVPVNRHQLLGCP